MPLLKIIPPTNCPECDSILVVYTDKSSNITSLWCDNIECPGRVRGTLSYIGGRDILEIDGLADDMASKIAKAGYARNLGELFEFQVEALGELTKLGEDQFMTRMAKQGFSVLILKMLKSLENAKTADWNRWISALGIPFVGRTLGKLLAKELKLEPDDMLNLCAKLEAAAARNIDGLGDVKSGILKNWSLDPVNRGICATLYNCGVRPKPLTVAGGDSMQQSLAGVTFCITGDFKGGFGSRGEITQKLESLGAVSKSGVSKKTSMLLRGEAAGATKLSAAQKLGIPIEGEDWLRKVYQDNGWETKNTGSSIEES